MPKHFHGDPNRLTLDQVIVGEYLTFMEFTQSAGVQIYARPLDRITPSSTEWPCVRKRCNSQCLTS